MRAYRVAADGKHQKARSKLVQKATFRTKAAKKSPTTCVLGRARALPTRLCSATQRTYQGGGCRARSVALDHRECPMPPVGGVSRPLFQAMTQRPSLPVWSL